MAGAGKGNGKGPAVGAVFGGFCLLGLFLFGISTAIVLSLISIYTPNNSKQNRGDQFTISALGLKALSSTANTSDVNGAAVAENARLSALCTSQFSSVNSPSNFAGCVVTNVSGYGANTSETARRRRQSPVFGLFLIGTVNLYYTTTCGRSGDSGKGANATDTASCVRRRLAQCNALINATANALTPWTPIPAGMSLSVFNSATSQYQDFSITNILGMRSDVAENYANARSLAARTRSLIRLGCTYTGPISLDAITSALAAQSSATTTLPTTTIASG